MLDDELLQLVEPIASRQREINTYVIQKICARINQIGKLLPSDIHKLETLYKSGADVREIETYMAQLTTLQMNSIKKLIKEAAADCYLMAKPYYDFRRKPFIPFNQNQYMQRLVNAMGEQTASTYRNLANAGAFMLRDKSDPKKLIPTRMAVAYQNVVDKAIQAVQMGTEDYGSAMRSTINDLVNSGIVVPMGAEDKVRYQSESGRIHYQRLDTAVRRNILNAVAQLNQEIQNQVGKDFGADGVEITVLSNPAPDHAPIQGHQFTMEQFENMQTQEPFEDVNGVKYEAIERRITEWNCRHIAYNIVIGVSAPTYSDSQLQAILDRNDQGYTTKGGKHLTRYECAQKQRQFESTIRKYKDMQIAFRAAGPKFHEDAMRAQAKINEYTAQYKLFSAQAKIQIQPHRLTVSGYHPIIVKL